MMKNFKNIDQLKAEKKRIKEHEDFLVQKIQHDWSRLKEGLRPSDLVKDAYHSMIENKARKSTGYKSILKSILVFGLTLLATKLADKAVQKFENMIRK